MVQVVKPYQVRVKYREEEVTESNGKWLRDPSGVSVLHYKRKLMRMYKDLNHVKNQEGKILDLLEQQKKIKQDYF